MLYHQTMDILYARKFLGHKKIENTRLNIQLAQVIFKETNDEFTVRVTSKPEEIKQLIKVGLFVCRKRWLAVFQEAT